VNPLVETGLIVQRELRKNFRSVKGIALLVLSMLGGTGATLLLVKFQQFKREELGDVAPDQIREFREHAYTRLFDDPATGKYLAQAPEVLYLVLQLTIWLAPLLIALLGFDAVSGELQHKGVRYWTVRARRSSIFLGKFLGLWATVSVITLAMHALIWVVCVMRGEASTADSIGWGARFYVVTLPIGAAWCGIATCVGGLFRTPIISLLTIMSSFFLLWLLWVIGVVSKAEAMEYFYPNYWDKWLLSPRVDKAMSGVGACALFALATLTAGTVYFQKRDV
jgi:ABC-type transport system involved in multi-copper enzyme maturation permease subunit